MHRSFLFFLSLMTTLIHAGNYESLRFTRLGIQDGLSDQTVYGILQDSRGFMWFSTEHGLNRYDGVSFKSWYHHDEDPHSLSASDMNYIVEDSSGMLWLGTWGGGLNAFDPRTGKATHFRHDPKDPSTISSDYIQALHEGRNGILWVGTQDGGLNRFDRKSGTFTRYLADPTNDLALHSARVWGIYEEYEERVWVATNTGVSILNPRTGNFRRFIPEAEGEKDLSTEPVRCMVPGPGRILWLGSGHGLARIRLDDMELDWFPDENEVGEGLDEIIINTLLPHDDGLLTIGTVNHGLIFFNEAKNQVKRFPADPRNPFALSSMDVRNLYVDKSENLWVATRSGGISKGDFKETKFALLKHEPGSLNGFPFGDIRAIHSDEENLWVGTRTNGLSRLKKGEEKWRHYRHENDAVRSLSRNNITSILKSRSGNLWVGTSFGLNRYIPRSDDFDHYFNNGGDPSSLLTSIVNCLAEDGDGNIWVGLHQGISVFVGNRFKHYVHAPDDDGSLGPGRVNVLLCDQDDTIWSGAGPHGLYRFEPATNQFEWIHLKENAPSALRSNGVQSLAHIADDLWIGLFGGGLIRYDLKLDTFQSIPVFDKSIKLSIVGILPGNQNELWLSTNRGLTLYRSDTGKHRNFGIFDGLQSLQFSRGSAFKDSNGVLYFGGVEGLNYFRADAIEDHYYVPNVVVSSVQIDDVTTHDYLPDGLEILLDPEHQKLTFDYAALDFTRPESNLYTTFLEGFDSDWRKPTRTTTATYPRLEAGSYTFRVKGANHDGVWNSYGTHVKVQVASSFFEEWFFFVVYVCIGLISLLLIFAFFKYRDLNKAKVHALEKSERMAIEANKSKSAFLAHVSHELRTPLNAIIGFTELMDEDLVDFDPSEFSPEQCRTDLVKIKSAAYVQLAQVNNLLELTKIESGKSELYLETFDIRQMVSAVLHHVLPLLQKTQNRLEVRYLPEAMGQMTADFMKVQGILINLLNNANKFTRKGLISLTVMRENDGLDHRVQFKVQDTGRGMSDEQLSHLFDGFTLERGSEDHEFRGLGLHITAHFSQMMGGTVQVESQLTKGSTFHVTLPADVRG